MDVGDVHAARGVAAHGLLGHAARLVGRVVQDLDLEELARILDLADGVDQPIGDVHLVVDRQLDRDRRQGVERPGGDWLPPLVLHVQVNKVVPVPSVYREDDQYEEICGEDERLRRRHAGCGREID